MGISRVTTGYDVERERGLSENLGNELCPANPIQTKPVLEIVS